MYEISPGGRRVMRSEVWNNFELCGLTAICRVCNESLKVGPTRQTSSLWRHWKRHRVPSRENGWNPKNSQKPPNNSSSKQLRLNFPNEHESHLQTQTSSPTLSHHSSPGSDDQCEFKNNTVVRMVVEFIIENAILPTSSIIQSLSFKCLISMANGPVTIPSPACILNDLAPKMYDQNNELLKMSICNEFFTLIFNNSELPRSRKKLIRVSASKVGENFTLSSQTLSVIIYEREDELVQQLRHFLNKILKVESWQISAIVHDENKEFSNLCDNISSPEFPSIRSLLKNRMNLKSDVLQELYGQLSLNGESPVSVLVICQLDKIFEDQPNMNLRDTWKNKFTGDHNVQSCLFLSPGWSFRSDLYSEEQWTRIASQIVEELLESPQFALLDNFCTSEPTDSVADQQRSLIEAEVSNYINTIIALDESSGQKEPMGGETAKLSTVEGTIGWWKHNSIKFPKLAQLARQYLSIVPCNQTELDRQNAAYADNILESGIDCVDSEKVSKLLSLRSAIIERSTLP